MTCSIPESLQPTLSAITSSIAAKLPGLHSLTLYGSAARNLYQPGISDVNLLFVVPAADLPALAILRDLLATAGASGSLCFAPYLVTAAELPRVATAFPTRILDMKRGYIVLYGQDLLAALAIDHCALAVRTRQELLNLLLRFRHALLRCDEACALGDDLRSFLPSFTKTLRTLVYLKTSEHIDDRTALFSAASKSFGLPGEILVQLVAWRQGRISLQGAEFKEASEALLGALEKAAIAETAHG